MATRKDMLKAYVGRNRPSRQAAPPKGESSPVSIPGVGPIARRNYGVGGRRRRPRNHFPN